MATNLTENFIQWNSPRNAYFSRYARQLGVTFFFNIVAPEGGHEIFDHQIGRGITKILPRYFRNFMISPIPKKMVAHVCEAIAVTHHTLDCAVGLRVNRKVALTFCVLDNLWYCNQNIKKTPSRLKTHSWIQLLRRGGGVIDSLARGVRGLEGSLCTLAQENLKVAKIIWNKHGTR